MERPSGCEHRDHAPPVLEAGLALDQPDALHPIDLTREAAAGEHEPRREILHAETAASFAELEEDVVPRERQSSLVGELVFEVIDDAGVDLEEAAPNLYPALGWAARRPPSQDDVALRAAANAANAVAISPSVTTSGRHPAQHVVVRPAFMRIRWPSSRQCACTAATRVGSAN